MALIFWLMTSVYNKIPIKFNKSQYQGQCQRSIIPSKRKEETKEPIQLEMFLRCSTYIELIRSWSELSNKFSKIVAGKCGNICSIRMCVCVKKGLLPIFHNLDFHSRSSVLFYRCILY